MSLEPIIRLFTELEERHLRPIMCKLDRVLIQQEKLMSGFDDLKKAVADETAAVNAEISAVNAVIAALKAGGITDEQAEALATTLQASVTALNTEATTAGQ